ncbi:nitroreductase family protein [Methanosphaerula palustris]|uniref:Nitroreductase n=1 Tax=Methanosphaerula palustris (strain ATCC BAA-1556 / DSM 19958 / E1-9c) TaxID=521011 RepID=B8GIJ2_METPE|nr:nitroreductase family protein [Methanosphaerula palustris]ACL16805.1 nitroreductase [Methanosphaerula palustris E1-9c]
MKSTPEKSAGKKPGRDDTKGRRAGFTIHVDNEKCTRCGSCTEVCRGVLGMGNNGPEIVSPSCIRCGQCVAVCPVGALDHSNAPLANQVPRDKFPVIDAGTAEQFIRSRRSVRNYRQKAVPREKILELLDIARFAPTPSNLQGVVYRVFDDPDTLHRITAAVIDWAEGEGKKDPAAVSGYTANYARQVTLYRENGDDVVLRSAPCLVVAMADENLDFGRDNSYLSLAYVQLLAPSLGLGTCWAGFFEYCAATGYEPLLRLLNLPEHMRVTTGMMVGYPKYTYHRQVDRNPLQVTWE